SSEKLLQQRETRTLIRHCIDRLPDTYRTVLLLRDIEELNTEEAADVLGITRNAVKIRLHRARQALRTLLERGLVGTGRAYDPRCRVLPFASGRIRASWLSASSGFLLRVRACCRDAPPMPALPVVRALRR